MFRSLMVGVMMVGGCSSVFADNTNAGAATKPMKPVTSFGYLDTDKDTRVSREEAKADWAVVQGFAQADADRDGFLDKNEFAQLTRG